MRRYSILLTGLWLLAAGAQGQAQSDWSGGPGQPGPVSDWAQHFEASSDIAWRPIPGQLALASTPLSETVQHPVTDDAGIPNSVAVGDINGDGRQDLVTTDPVTNPFDDTGAVEWWEQAPDGSFHRHTLQPDFYGATYADTVDLDGDGDLDIIAAAYYGVAIPPPPPPDTRNGRYAWFENLDGRGLAWRKHTVGENYWGANWIDVADFDGDDDLDLVGASYLTDGIWEQEGDVVWFENLDGDGESWAEREIDGDLSGALEAHAADLDGDGDADVVAANLGPFEPNHFHWYENLEGDGSEWVRHQIPIPFTGAGYLDIADVDDDGDPDLLGGGLHSGEVGFFENLSGGDSWQASFVAGLVRTQTVEASDLDGDGDLDALIVTASGFDGGGAVWWSENLDGAGVLWSLHTVRTLIDTPWARAGDLDSDGKLDIAVSDEDLFPYGEPELAWYEPTGFRTSGQLTSSILDGGASPDWGVVAWDSPQTGLELEIRAAEDPKDLGPFQAVEAGSYLGDVIDPTAPYLQYRVSLVSSDQDSSPVLREIDVDALFLAPPEPGIAGETNTLVARWAQPGTQIFFLGSPTAGSTAIPPCPGIELGLAQPRMLGSAIVDADRNAVLQLPIPPGAAGKGLRFQAVAPTSCAVSAAVEALFE